MTIQEAVNNLEQKFVLDEVVQESIKTIVNDPRVRESTRTLVMTGVPDLHRWSAARDLGKRLLDGRYEEARGKRLTGVTE